jgi:hypothetical protein
MTVGQFDKPLITMTETQQTASAALSINLVSVKEASEILGISVYFCHYLIRAGQLHSVGRFVGAHVLNRHEVLKFKSDRERGLTDRRKTRWKH